MEIGIVYELFGAYPRRPDDPPDAQVEYEPEATLLALEAAIRRLGHQPVRLGRPTTCWRRVRRAPSPWTRR
jgi:D-alanine-D-alanine ligase